MCSVYSNSFMNFAATSSRDGSGRLFHSQNSLLSQPCVVSATWVGLQAGVYLCVNEYAWDRHVQDGPLNKRGWVLQERVLAPRTIYCASDQLWWSCADTDPCCNEAFPNGVLEQRQQQVNDPIIDLRLLAEKTSSLAMAIGDSSSKITRRETCPTAQIRYLRSVVLLRQR